MSEQGYLVISDITGYTAFLTGSELEHAHGILDEIFDVLINATKPPLVISKLEGDAIFAYAPEGSFFQGQSLIETIENIYGAFRKLLDRMHLNTTCECTACSNIPNLDLKFFVHYGTYSIRNMGGREELSGPDVILIHRLMKNTVTEKTGMKAYALYSKAAMDKLNLPEVQATLTPHTETYEHLGEVSIYLENVHSTWARVQHHHHVLVTPEDAWIMTVGELPVSLELAWDYLTQPEHRAVLVQSEISDAPINLSDGRIAAGSVYHCAHGTKIVKNTILDWHPFEYYTFDTKDLFGSFTLVNTFFLTPLAPDRTRIETRWSNVTKGNPVLRFLINTLMKPMFTKISHQMFDRLSNLVQEHQQQGIIIQPKPVKLSTMEISIAIQASLNASQ